MSISKKFRRPPDLVPPPAPSALTFHDSIPPQVRAGISSALSSAGMDLAASPLHFAPATAPLKPGVQTVALYDGRIARKLGALLAGDRPALLCAQTSPSELPNSLHLRLIAALHTGRPLRPSDAQWRRAIVGSLKDVERIMEQLIQSASERGAQAAGALSADVAYEFIANALLDAPANPDGTPKYAHRREENPTIAAEDACGLAVGLDDRSIYLSVVDRFGRLGAEPIIRNIQGWGQQAKLHTEGGGAGLGFRRILEATDVLTVRVQEGKRTEVFAAVSLTGPRRRGQQPKSVFYWKDRRGDGQ